MKDFLNIELAALGKAFIWSVLLCLVAGAIVNLTSLSENLLPYLGKAIFLLTVFVGAFYSARAYGSKGLIRGINMGLLFFITILIITMILQKAALGLTTLLWVLLQCIAAGGAGGIAGISSRK
jgi:putative membrane protein (TIGR04086 family)